MTVRRTGIIRVVALPAVLAALCLAAAAAPTSRPARPAAVGQPAPAIAAAPRPAATTRPAPVRSEVGQSLIRRGDATAPTTQPASTGAAPVSPAAPTLEFARVAGALAIVLTLIFALRGVMKRAFGANGAVGSSRSVVVLSRTILGPKQQVMVLRVGRRLIVVGDSGGQMNTLSEITDPDEVAALVGQLKDEKLSSAAPTFGGLLGRLRNGMEAGGWSPDTGRYQRTPPSEEDEGPGRGLIEGDDEEAGPEPEADSTREEISGLLAKVRLISHQFKGT